MGFTIPIDVDRPDFDKVKNRLRNKDRLKIGRSHNNTILDTRKYEIEYKDGHTSLLAVNEISENMFVQVDGEVNWHIIFQDIVDHGYRGTGVKYQDAFIVTCIGTKCRREMMKRV